MEEMAGNETGKKKIKIIRLWQGASQKLDGY